MKFTLDKSRQWALFIGGIGLAVMLAGFYLFPRRHWSCLFFYLCLVFPSILFLRELRTVWKESLVAKLALIFGGYTCCSYFFTGERSDISHGMGYLLYLFATVIFIPQVVGFLKNKQCVWGLVWGAVAGIAAVLAVTMYFLSGAYLGRLGMFFSKVHPVPSSALYGMGVVAILCYLVNRKCVPRKITVIGICLLSVLLMAILLAYSRAGILACLAAVATAALLGGKRVLYAAVISMALAIALFYYIPHFDKRPPNEKVVYLSYSDFAHFDTRFGRSYLRRSQVELASDSMIEGLIKRRSAGRLELWTVLANRMRPAEWITGRGVNAGHNYGQLTSPHSTYVWALYHTGLIGLLLMLSVQLACLWQSWVRWKSCSNSVPLLFLVFSFFHLATNGNVVISSPTVYSLLYWIPICMVLAPAETAVKASSEKK